MAEQVQATLDAMVEPLANLQHRDIFSADEIAATIARRRESEYRLQRKRQPRLSDYLSYIAVEEQLEQLRRVRMDKKQQVLYKKKKQKPEEDEQNKIGDRHILQHLLRIWKRTLQKFPSPDLYHQHAASCERFGAHFALSRCYQDALSLYGTTHADLWIAAAQHEMVHNTAMGAARIVLQRALRVLKSSSNRFDVWRASFVLELHWVQKLEGRRAILGSEKRKERSDETQGSEVGKQITDAYKVAKIIYKNAMAADEAEPMWSWKLLKACRGFPAASLEGWILDQLLSDDETNPDLWMARARYYAEREDDSGPPAKRSKIENGTNNAEDLVLGTIRQACSAVPTPDMYRKALGFLGTYDTDGASSLLQDLRSDIAQKEQLQNAADLMLCYVDSMNDSNEAVQLLSQYVKSRKRTDVSIWTELARHIYQKDGPAAAQAMLEPNPYPLSDPDHIVISVQQLGLQVCQRNKASFALLERILLLSPANPLAVCHRPVVEGWIHLPAVCVVLLQSLSEDTTIARKAYTAMLATKCWTVWIQQAPESVGGIIDTALALEADFPDAGVAAQQQKQLYEKAIESFKGSLPDLARHYRQRRDDTIRFRHAASVGSKGAVPCVTFPNTSSEAGNRRIQELYRKFYICLVQNVSENKTNDGKTMGWEGTETLFKSLTETDRESWSTESSSTNLDTATRSISPKTMLSPLNAGKMRGYCSFIIQKDKNAYNQATQRLLPFSSFSGMPWQYESALWLFFGRNPLGSPPLQGRREHTDSISHDGTWHYQLAGTKTWYVRPTEELLREQPLLQSNTSLVVQCNAGDVLIINTRLWFHRTEIPAQKDPSVSYARDFVYCVNDNVDEHAQSNVSNSMTNVEGMYATNDIEQGAVVFTEEDMPNGELHRSSQANCNVCELQDGMQAVISIRPIKSGEFFCIPESGDDGSDSLAD